MQRNIGLWATVLVMGLAFWPACVDKKPAEKAVKPTSELTERQKQMYILKAPPSDIAFPNSATFKGDGGEIELLGADVEPKELKAGGEYQLTLYFRAVKPTATPQKIFVHTEAYGGPRMRSGADHDPVLGKYPTNQWKPGEIIVDVFNAKLGKKALPGVSKIHVGFFSGKPRMAATGDRIDNENRVHVADLVVAGNLDPKLFYEVVKTKGKMKIDGKFEEKDWNRAPMMYLKNPKSGKDSKEITEWKALWNDDTLFFAFTVFDKDIKSRFEKRDDPLYQEDVIEIFFDADGDLEEYHEIEVNPAGVLFDALFSGYRTGKNLDWNPAIEAKVLLDGTLNKDDDEDRTWTVEMAVPLSEISTGKPVPPQPGDMWRGNIYRLNVGKGIKRNASSWARLTTGDYHELHSFGGFVFVIQPTPSSAADTTGGATIQDKAPSEVSPKQIAPSGGAVAVPAKAEE